MSTNDMSANARKQAAHRKRKADAGLVELRGVWAPAGQHAELKRIAAEHLELAKPAAPEVLRMSGGSGETA